MFAHLQQYKRHAGAGRRGMVHAARDGGVTAAPDLTAELAWERGGGGRGQWREVGVPFGRIISDGK